MPRGSWGPPFSLPARTCAPRVNMRLGKTGWSPACEKFSGTGEQGNGGGLWGSSAGAVTTWAGMQMSLYRACCASS